MRIQFRYRFFDAAVALKPPGPWQDWPIGDPIAASEFCVVETRIVDDEDNVMAQHQKFIPAYYEHLSEPNGPIFWLTEHPESEMWKRRDDIKPSV